MYIGIVYLYKYSDLPANIFSVLFLGTPNLEA